MTIAEVSKKYDITPDTLRYYERIGLLSNVPRSPSGIRNLKIGKTKFKLSTIIKTCTNGSSEMVTNLSMSLINILFNM